MGEAAELYSGTAFELEDIKKNRREKKMADNDYGPSADFALFNNKFKKTDKHPDYRSSFEMPRSLLKEMVEIAKRGETPILEIAAWNAEARTSGTKYISGRIQVDHYNMKKKKEEGGQPERHEQEEEPEDDDSLFD